LQGAQGNLLLDGLIGTPGAAGDAGQHIAPPKATLGLAGAGFCFFVWGAIQPKPDISRATDRRRSRLGKSADRRILVSSSTTERR